jgi:hypothetical protein
MAEYTSVQNVKEDLGITTMDYDNSLQRAIKSMSRYIESVIGYTLDRKAVTERFDLGVNANAGTIYLGYRPVNSVTSIDIVVGASSEELDASEYFVYPDHVKLNRYSIGNQTLEIVYNAGYLIDWANQDDPTKHNLPDDIEDVCRQLVIQRYNRRDGKELKAETIGSWSRQFALSSDKGDALIKDVLKYYALPSL